MSTTSAGHQLPLEARLQYEILRAEISQVQDLEQMRLMALRMVQLMELQRKVVAAMLRQGYLESDLKPRPVYPGAGRSDQPVC